MILASFYINPIPKGRPRFGKGRAYTPTETRRYESAIHALATKHAHACNIQPLTGPIEVAVNFYITRPQTVKREHPCVKPDLDNFEKAVLDACNEVFWIDDGQICQKFASKTYVQGPGYITIQVKEI